MDPSVRKKDREEGETERVFGEKEKVERTNNVRRWNWEMETSARKEDGNVRAEKKKS